MYASASLSGALRCLRGRRMGIMSDKQPVSDFGKLQGILVGVPIRSIEPQYRDGKRVARLVTWTTGETCLVADA